MSYWTYVHGTVVVSPIGRTQAEKRYILETVLDHLPVVSGSERDMSVYILQKAGHNSSSSCDEFGEVTNNLVNRYGDRSRKRGWLRTQDEYILVVDGALRDRQFEQTFREFQKWLCRLAKRVNIVNVLVHINDWDKSTIVREYATGYPKHKGWMYRTTAYGQMFENPTWVQNRKGVEHGEPNWCEYLMWERAKGSNYPMMLGYKYYADPDNDAEVERRIKYKKGE